MFRQLIGTPFDSNAAQAAFALHPSALSALIERAWASRRNVSAAPLGHPDRRSDLGSVEPGVVAAYLNRTAPVFNDFVWDHLIYAYMIENTRIYEIFRALVQALNEGESVGILRQPGSRQWLTVTEQLFYRDPPPLHSLAVVSDVRSDMGATRRNAYYRMFNMELNHGRGDSQPYVYPKPQASNSEFVTSLESLLAEVWVGITNLSTTSGPNPTDDQMIANLAESLKQMLLARRQGGALAQEEFQAVTMMSWFHATVLFDSPIVIDLGATALSPEQRLARLAERARVPMHTKAESFFEMAGPLSTLLISTEAGLFDTPAQARALYASPTLAEDLRKIINHWSVATGRDLKVPKQRGAAA